MREKLTAYIYVDLVIVGHQDMHVNLYLHIPIILNFRKEKKKYSEKSL
jgi:hypothetical protein